MLNLKNRADLQRLVDESFEETLTLEYKASPALRRDDIDELCKDVSAMANSAGGQIIYGIEEDRKTHKPSKVDQGVTDPKITREWIHQVLSSNIQPRIDGIKIQRIALSDDGYGYVISIQPTTIGPHQSKDKKYYKRFELQAVPMADYEIRDIMRRSTTPDLDVLLSFGGDDLEWEADFDGHREISQTFFLWATLINRSPTPANYAIVEVWIDHDVKVPFANQPLKHVRMESNNSGQTFRVFQHTLMSPPGVPVFKEGIHESHSVQIPLQLPLKFWESSMVYLETSIQAPGFSTQAEWHIQCNAGRMRLRRYTGN